MLKSTLFQYKSDTKQTPLWRSGASDAADVERRYVKGVLSGHVSRYCGDVSRFRPLGDPSLEAPIAQI